MKTQEEIKKEIEALKAVRPNVRPYSMFGDDNLAAFDAQVEVLEQDMDDDEVSDRFDCSGIPENVMSSAFHALDWINGEEDFDGGSLAEGWSPIKKGK